MNHEQLSGEKMLNARGNHWMFELVGHLKPGVTPAQATADLNSVDSYLKRSYPKEEGNEPYTLALPGLHGGQTWEQALSGIKGIGPWTVSVFRIMVLREPDVLPLGDVGLERAIANVYGPGHDVSELGARWRPFRSVACWYLWRTLGNEQLG